MNQTVNYGGFNTEKKKAPKSKGFSQDLESQLMSKDWIDNAYFMQKKARSKVPQYMSFGKNTDMNKTMNSFKDTQHTMGQSGANVFGKNN